MSNNKDNLVDCIPETTENVKPAPTSDEDEFLEKLQTLVGKTVASVSLKVDDTEGLDDGVDAISVTTEDGTRIVVCINWETLSLNIYDDRDLGGK